MNKVILLGRLGSDGELKVTQGGQAILKFSLATSEKFKDKAGVQQEKTEWHRCNLWGDRATKLAQYLTKGKQLLVEGSIQYGSYEKDGVKHYTTDIRAFSVEFVGTKGDSSPAPAASDADEDGLPAVNAEDIPF